ncbi:permease [Verrucomicrobiaceae bacterium N1E253]|uniref:Permease n=1 Tax=Oceaniferula marina TaxID=2748318 RepID=A0A851GKQ1_9BACT|nr:permease [Oceaniferula marina]NWK54744.1 permease [Oceaniferula marina]
MSFSDHRQEWRWATGMTLIFLAAWWLPVDSVRFQSGIDEAMQLTQWYAREHVVYCLLPAFFIAGAIASFIRQGSVMKYLSAEAHRVTSYLVASVSGTILAVCSCTVLPLFAGIYRMGSGLGPATSFLYAGPAISALAIVMSSKVLGIEMGLARSLGAIVFSLLIGLCMATIFKKEEQERQQAAAMQWPEEENERPLWQTLTFLGTQISILIFANWGPSDHSAFALIYDWKWWIVSVSALALAVILGLCFDRSWLKISTTAVAVVLISILSGTLAAFSVGLLGLTWIIAGTDGETGEWWRQSWSFTKLVMPLLLAGVFVTGLLVGRPGHEAWIPNDWINQALGGDGLLPVFYASFAGSLMYFATLTEIPIVEALQGAGMGNGAALALLLAGPALSLPNMLVIRSILGTRKTLTYITLVVIFSTFAGWTIAPLLN